MNSPPQKSAEGGEAQGAEVFETPPATKPAASLRLQWSSAGPALVGHLPPHSIEAEESLLSCCLCDEGDSLQRCIDDGVTGAFFFSPANGLVFSTLCELHRTIDRVDASILAEELMRIGEFAAVGGMPYIMQISGRESTTVKVPYWLHTVREYYGRREYLRNAQLAIERAGDLSVPVSDLLDEMKAGTDGMARLGRKGLLAKRLAECRFDPAIKLAEPRVIYRINKAPICTEGNLATITAEAKAGKTAFVEALIAAAITRSEQIDALGLVGRNEAGLAFIHFDTEQSPHDHAAVLGRALRRAKREAWPEWFQSYRLAGKEPHEVQDLLDHALQQAKKDFGGIFAATLDGIGDFVFDVNDQKECNPLVLHLHEQAIAYQTSIISVLHVNPGSQTGKTRGHLGSHLERKAATNLLLEKEDEVTTVWSKKNRGTPITKADGPRFSWDQAAEMHLSVESGRSAKELRKIEDLHELAVECYAGQKALTYSDLWRAIESSAKVCERTAKERCTEMKKLGVIRFTPPNLYVMQS